MATFAQSSASLSLVWVLFYFVEGSVENEWDDLDMRRRLLRDSLDQNQPVVEEINDAQ